MPSVVCWIANIPQQFGYPMHANILSNAPDLRPDLRMSQYSEYNIGGEPIESPYSREEIIFNADLIIDTLRHFPQAVAAPPAPVVAAPEPVNTLVPVAPQQQPEGVPEAEKTAQADAQPETDKTRENGAAKYVACTAQ